MLDPELRRRMYLKPVTPSDGQTYEQALEFSVQQWCYIARAFLDWDADIDTDALRTELDRITRAAQRSAAIAGSVERLPDGQRSVLKRRMLGVPLDQIADQDGVGIEAVRQVEAEAINDLCLLVDADRDEIRDALGLAPKWTDPGGAAVAALAEIEPWHLGLSAWTHCVLADEGVLTMYQLLCYAFHGLAELEADGDAVREIRERVLALAVRMAGSAPESIG